MGDKARSVKEGKTDDFSRSELKRRVQYILIALSALLIISIIPTPEILTVQGQRALGILAFVGILWVTEALPMGVTALLGVILLPVLGIVEPKDSFVGFGSTALFFLLGAFSFSTAMQKTNLHKRVAVKFLRSFGKSSTTLIFGLIILSGLLSWTIPCHAVAALLLPVVLGILEAGKVADDSNFTISLLLALTYGTSVGSIASLLGGARNVLAIGILENLEGISLGFVEWMVAGIPISLALMVLTFFVLRVVFPWDEIDVDKVKDELEDEMEELGPMSVGEKKAAIIFIFALILWVTVGTGIGLATVAVGGMIMLYLTRTITWRDIEQNMPWGILFLYGGALSISSALQVTGSVDFIASGLTSAVGPGYPFLLLAIFLVLIVFLSNVMSNAAATAVILPIAIPTLATSFSPQVSTFLIAMGAAMAFMLPVATPSAALVYSTGRIDLKNLLKAGIVLGLLSIVVFLTVGLGWWKIIGLW